VSLSKVIDTARGELGYTESPPGSNRTKYGEAFGWDGVPWCVIFLWWCFREAGEGMAFFGGGKTASCGTLLRWYREQGQTVPVKDVRAGDIVILNFSGTQETQHCGLVIAVNGIYITTIEGNTSEAGSQSNGGMVCQKTRYPSQIVGVCRPRYQEETMPKKDYEGRWSEQDMRWADEAGLIKGYEDGTYRPTQPMTREEVVALLHRYDAAKELGKL
jgi:hypothetical protein